MEYTCPRNAMQCKVWPISAYLHDYHGALCPCMNMMEEAGTSAATCSAGQDFTFLYSPDVGASVEVPEVQEESCKWLEKFVILKIGSTSM